MGVIVSAISPFSAMPHASFPAALRGPPAPRSRFSGFGMVPAGRRKAALQGQNSVHPTQVQPPYWVLSFASTMTSWPITQWSKPVRVKSGWLPPLKTTVQKDLNQRCDVLWRCVSLACLISGLEELPMKSCFVKLRTLSFLLRHTVCFVNSDLP